MSDGKPSVFSRYVEHSPKKESPTEPEIVRRGPQPIIPLAHFKSSPSHQFLAKTRDQPARHPRLRTQLHP
jgi:hypothetical protein